MEEQNKPGIQPDLQLGTQPDLRRGAHFGEHTGVQTGPEPGTQSDTQPGEQPDAQSDEQFGEPVVIKRKERRIFRDVVEILIFLVNAIIVTTLLKAFVIEQYEIPTGSMEPTIEIGDRLFAEKVSYYIGSPTPGDIVTFDDPIKEGRVLIKRCIATEGQTVDLRDGKVVVDGVVLAEPYVHDRPSLPLEEMSGVDIDYPYTIPAGSVWVMGDNRTNSLDSRYFGPVLEDDITGRAILRFLPFSRFGPLDG
jgi:signal peptidase I